MTIEEEKNDRRGWPEHEEPIPNNKPTSWNFEIKETAMTQSDAPNEGREEKIATQIARKIAAIPENNPEHAADHKLRAIEEIIDNTIKMVERHTGKELRDQLSKERERVKEWKTVVDELYPALQKEREMRKELVDGIKKAVYHLRVDAPFIAVDIDSLIAKASELDKNN